MPRATLTRPAPTEYAAHYATYIQHVPEGDIVDTLEHQLGDTLALLAGLSAEQAAHRYAPGKWSIKQVVGHISDAERVFAYRAMRFARNDTTPLPPFDENEYVRNATFDDRALPDLAAEFEAVRRASVCLFRGLDDEALMRRGTASGHEVTPRALANIIAGHERHHTIILRERYL